MRVLIYSHDSFGLGHLRRCRAIAHSLVDCFKDLSVLILSGSPIIGSFDFRSRVDFVRIPGVIKLRNGDYTSLNLKMDIGETIALRSSLILQTAKIFNPDLFLVDKEPWGLRGEVKDTLGYLNEKHVPCILGLRDVMDDPLILQEEWGRKNVIPALSELYEEIWVYGLQKFYDPLMGLEIPEHVRQKIQYTGYLRRKINGGTARLPDHLSGKPYILVTPGGGGDGDYLIDWVLAAYETDPHIPTPALIVLGPFMPAELRQSFHIRASRLDQVHVMTFENYFETLMDQCAGIVAMGGYNTFCEILSFDKPAVLVPRSIPRREQSIRAENAQRLGLVKMLATDSKDPQTMIDALRALPYQPKPSVQGIDEYLAGLVEVCRLAQKWLPSMPIVQPSRVGSL